MRLSRIEPHPVLARIDAVSFDCCDCGDSVTELRGRDAQEDCLPPRLRA